MIVLPQLTHDDSAPWHRCMLRVVLSDNSGWQLGESGSGVLAQFGCEDDRLHFVWGVSGRNVKCLPMEGLKVYVCLPYVAGRKCCDTRGTYVES